MGLFSSNYNKPGPGIPKDAPQKKGVELFFDILGREFWSLFTLNFIYILACIPIITIGPATAALSRVTVTMVRDCNVYVWRDFWDAFRKNIKQGIIFGIPSTLFVIAAVVIDFNLLLSVAAGGESVFTIALIFLWTFLGTALGCYIFPMVSYVDLPSLPLLKNSMLLLVLGKWRTLFAALVSIGCASLVVLYYPISMLVTLLGIFGFLSFFTSFMVWPVIQKYVVDGWKPDDGADAQPETENSDTTPELP